MPDARAGFGARKAFQTAKPADCFLNVYPDFFRYAVCHSAGSWPGSPGSPEESSMLSATTPIAMANGSATNVTFNAVPLDTPAALAAANAMLPNPNGYFNVHTPANPGGAVRGQLVRQ
jgi:CHRD domain